MALNGQQQQPLAGFDVVLEETIFFPEGGGQPCDIGCLGDEEVVHVRRDGDKAILFVRSKNGEQQTPCFKVGDEPLQLIDWTRRFDHMQQHSSQHLISALAMSNFNMDTTSWSLGAEVSYIEFNVPEIGEQTLIDLEDACNAAIVEAIPVGASYLVADRLGEIRARMTIPDDNSGMTRIITIGKDKNKPIDENPCCGTHVSNLLQLQMIKFLYTQKGKKGKSLLYFVAGDRLRQYTAKLVLRERTLTASLKCLPEEVSSMIEKAQKNVKKLQKVCLPSFGQIRILIISPIHLELSHPIARFGSIRGEQVPAIGRGEAQIVHAASKGG